jgi:flagellar hook-basal body complex protein FliE
MKNENPVQHGIIKTIRDKFNKYRHNKLSELKTAVRKLLNEGKTSTRSQAKDFSDWVNDALDNIKARAKTAEARNDATANEVKARQAVEAFKKVYFN